MGGTVLPILKVVDSKRDGDWLEGRNWVLKVSQRGLDSFKG